MEEDKKKEIDKFHRYFGVEFNNAIYKLTAKKDFTEIEKEEIISTAHAAVLHWQKFSDSTMANSVRGYYTVSKAYIVVDEKENALKYANLCLKLAQENKEVLADWDFAYAYEIMARASAMNNNKTDFEKYILKAKNHEIKDPEDLKYVKIERDSGNWFGFTI